MVEKRLSEFLTPEVALQAGCLGRVGSDDPLVTGLEYDSRKTGPGSLYFALPGLHVDGHDFIPQAVRRGARVIVHQSPGLPPGVPYERVVALRVRDSRFAMSPLGAAFYRWPSRRLAVVGVTGTEGKSTTVYLIYQLLRLAGKKAGFLSTVQYSDGGEVVWNPEHQTTPEAPAVQRLLAAMADGGAEYAVLEASSHGLSPRTNRLGDVAFDAGVMTNVTHEHLEFHGTWEQYRDDKANLFRALSSIEKDGKDGKKFGVVNADDPSAAYFAGLVRRCYTFSTRGAPADLAASFRSSDARGNDYDVLIAGEGGGKREKVRDNLPGAFNMGNVLAAVLAASGLLGLSPQELFPFVPRLKPVRGRMTAIDRGQPFEVVVDYAHTPSSFETIFPPLRQRLDAAGSGGRIISLFGSAGERDVKKRPEQGRVASRWSDIVILTDEDPRGEESMAILEEIARGCPNLVRGENLFLIPRRGEAIRKAFALARPGDLVLLLGKGHENSIIYAGAAVPYDEIGEAEAALTEMGMGMEKNAGFDAAHH